MKYMITYFAAFILLAGCNNNKEAGTTRDDKKGETTINMRDVVDSGEDMKKKTEELKKLTPLTHDELKKLLPEELLGMQRTNIESSDMGGYAVAEATYRKDQNDAAYLSVSVVDCAGEKGSGYYSYGYWTKMQITKESDDGYTRPADWNGNRVIESHKKNRDQYEVTYFTSDRFLVTIRGGKTGLDLVKQAAQSLNLKAN